MKITRVSFFAGLFLGLHISTANAAIYLMDRTIGAGSVTGYIETDGTIGVLAESNITDFELTLEAPNLGAPNPYTLVYGAANQYYRVNGTGLVASATEITFDFDLPYGHSFFIYNYGNAHYYCAHTTECFTDSPGPAETFGPQVPAYIHAQREVRSGVVTLATISAIPLPAALPLFASAAGLLGLLGWRRARS